MTEAIPELLPCPFCGGDSICREVRGNIRNPAEFYVTCVFQTCCGYHSESEGIWRSSEGAIKAWNRRDCSKPHAMTLQYQPELTHSVWVDTFLSDADDCRLSETELIDRLKQGVINGEWGGWRLVHIEQEVIGNVD